MSTAVRSLVARPGVGLTANVVQHGSLRLSRIAVDRPALVFLRHGTKILRNGSQQWTAHGGDVVAVAGGQSLDITNRLSSEGLFEARWVVWDDALVPAAASVPAAPETTAKVLKRPGEPFVSAIDRAVEAIVHRDEVPDAVARHRLAELHVWLAEHGVTLAARRTATMTQRLRDLFATAPAQAWTMGRTAARFAMSEATLRRRLVAEGTNFAAVLSDLRMSSAITLLQSTERPIAHIASDVGYESPSRFSVRFRSRFGFAPSQVRGHRR